MAKSKLFRNLKAGDKFVVETGYGIKDYRTAVVTVHEVRRIAEKGCFTGKTQWNVYGTFPAWWGSNHTTVYATDRVELVN